MHLLLSFIALSLLLLSYSTTTTATPTCFTIVHDKKPTGHRANQTVDTAIALASSLYAPATLGMSLPLGTSAIALHRISTSIYDETIMEDRKKIARLIIEANQYMEANGSTPKNQIIHNERKRARGPSTWRKVSLEDSTPFPRGGSRISSTAADTLTYPELTGLLRRLNFPFASKYNIEQVAPLIIEANQDQNFCSNPEVLRPVHFKDYVLAKLPR